MKLNAALCLFFLTLGACLLWMPTVNVRIICGTMFALYAACFGVLFLRDLTWLWIERTPLLRDIDTDRALGGMGSARGR